MKTIYYSESDIASYRNDYLQAIGFVEDAVKLPNVIIFDPGETTGYAEFNGGRLVDAGTIDTNPENELAAFENLRLAVLKFESRMDNRTVVIEEYRIYSHKAMVHAGSTIPTLRYIGGLQMICESMAISVVFQSASKAKGLVPDRLLERWNLLSRNNHTNDAIRHAVCYYMTRYHKESLKVRRAEVSVE